MPDSNVVFNAETCPNPQTIINDIHAKLIASINALQTLTCDNDAASIGRDNALATALATLKANTETALSNLSQVIGASSPTEIAALKAFVTENSEQIEALVAAIDANRASAAANTASATANTASTAANTALLATVQSLSNGLQSSVAALTTKVAAVEAVQATQGVQIGAVETAQATQAAQIAAIEASPQASISTAAIEAKNVEQDAEIAALKADTSAIDAVCQVLRVMKAAADALPSPTALACAHGIVPLAIPDLTLTVPAATPAAPAPSGDSGALSA